MMPLRSMMLPLTTESPLMGAGGPGLQGQLPCWTKSRGVKVSGYEEDGWYLEDVMR